MKKLFAALLCITILTTGCMGTTPRIVESYKYGDDKKSCEILQTEIDECEIKIKEKQSERTTKIVMNTVMTLVGLALFWPALFLIDAKSDQLAEIDGLIKRRESLGAIAVDNECEFCLGKDYSREKFLAENELPDLDKKPQSVDWDNTDPIYQDMN